MSSDKQKEDTLLLSLLVGNEETWWQVDSEGTVTYMKIFSHVIQAVTEGNFERLSEQGVLSARCTV